jgi:hypothetical protein
MILSMKPSPESGKSAGLKPADIRDFTVLLYIYLVFE